jgi:hypothetical protein
MTKAFDCVEMKRKGSHHVYKTLKGKTRDEQVEYWRRRNEEMRRWLGGRNRAGAGTRTAAR